MLAWIMDYSRDAMKVSLKKWKPEYPKNMKTYQFSKFNETLKTLKSYLPPIYWIGRKNGQRLSITPITQKKSK